MKHLLYLSVVFGLLLAGCSQKAEKQAPTTNAPTAEASAPSAAEATAGANAGNPITAPVDYLGAVAKAKQLAEKQIDIAQIEKAVMFFHEAEDRFPRDLNELVEKHYLPAIPKAPYGMEIVYDPNTGTVKVVKKAAPATKP